jgi:hypothetical protein
MATASRACGTCTLSKLEEAAAKVLAQKAAAMLWLEKKQEGGGSDCTKQRTHGGTGWRRQ